MPRQSRSMAASITLLSLVALVGCRARQADKDAADVREDRAMPTTVPAPVTITEQRPLPGRAQSMPVKEGAAPLAYMIESAANVRIVDLDTKQTIATAAVEEASPLVIDQKRGIRIGRKQILAGPLPAGHRYGIYLDTTEEGYYRTGITQPQRQEPSGVE